jgi:hypothetical protein
VRTVAAALPAIGGRIAVVLDDVWMPRWQRNVQDCVEQLGSDLEQMAGELYEDIADLQDKLNDERVAEVFHRAAQTARVASSVATRRRCRAAVINSIRQPENASVNLRFVRLIDELTPVHFTLLSLLQNPSAHEEYRSAVGSILSGGAFGPAVQALNYSEDLLRMLSADLQRIGLGELPSGIMSAQGLLAKRTTVLGDRFLDLVRHPVAGDDHAGD